MMKEIGNIPSVPQFEEMVIGAIVNEPDKISEVISILSPDCFYEPINAQIYEVIIHLYEANKKIDLATVGLNCKNAINAKGTNVLQYIVKCTQSVGSGAHLLSHARIVKEYFVRRSILSSASQLIAKASDTNEDILDTLTFLSKIADTANEVSAGGTTIHHIGKSLANALKSAENRQIATQSGKAIGVTTGLTDLDRITGGWQGSQLIVLAARPAMGKTALMLHFAKSAAASGVPVCIYSLEMSDISLANRLILSECDVDVNAFRSGRLSSDDWTKLEEATSSLQDMPIYVDDNPNVSMRYIKAHSKIMQKQGKCGLILVDYLQLSDTSTEKNRNREQEIAQASRQAKIIAKELDVPFILLSQLSRNVEGRSDKTPLLSDLRESGAIEQDADIVSFIYRPAYYKVDCVDTGSYGNISTEGLGILSIAKQRDGATGNVLFNHNPAMTQINDYGNTSKSEEPF